MIPLREQDAIREVFAEHLAGTVKLDLFTQRPAPVFVPGREECPTCAPTQNLLEELAHLSPRIRLTVHELARATALAARHGVQRPPAIVLRGVLNRPVLWYGLPWGGLFTVFIDLLIGVSGKAPPLAPALKRRLKRLKRDLPVEVFTTPDDPHGPEVARALAQFAFENGHLKLTVTEIAEFPARAQELQIQSVPVVIIDGRVRLPGAVTDTVLLDEVIKAAEHTVVTRSARLPGGGMLLDLPQAQAAQQGEVRPSGLIIPRR